MPPEIGTKIDNAQLFGLFPSLEGTIGMIYGLIRNGKTTEGVNRIVTSLKQGRVVYSNIPIDVDKIELDERKQTGRLLLSLIWPFYKTFYRFHKENFHYVDVDSFSGTSDLVDYLGSLTDCLIVWDEGWYLFDSYEGTKFSKSKRKLVLHTGHFNREIIVISQRPTAIQASARGNVQVFWKCTKILKWPYLLLRIEEIQEMDGEVPDETKIVSSRTYHPSKNLHAVFDTHFLRKGVPSSQEILYDAFKLNYWHKIKLLFRRVDSPSFLKEGRTRNKKSLGVKSESVSTTIKISKGEEYMTLINAPQEIDGSKLLTNGDKKNPLTEVLPLPF